jgi:hypothetical protein
MMMSLLCSITLSAEAPSDNGVTLKGLVVNDGAPSMVTFDVRWDRDNMPAVWSDTVWVFVDYNDAGTITRMPVTSASASAGTVLPLNSNQGARIVGNARTTGSFSATVQLVTFLPNIIGACVYASNYPPVGEYASTATISFIGTPRYDIELKNTADGTTAIVPWDGIDAYYYIPDGFTVESFTDGTGASGIIKCIPMAWYGVIDFVVFSVPTEQLVSFSVAKSPSIPGATLTYRWSAQGFSPDTCDEMQFNTATPSNPDNYPVTLTAHSERYCDLSVTHAVVVDDCHGGWLGSIPDQDCNGGRIGNQ